MKVKIFYVHDPSGGKGQHAESFESQINAWLAQNPTARIAHIKQSASGGSWGASLWMVSVWYE